MALAKRIFLLIVVNILVVLTISITLNLLGVHGYVNQYGIDYSSLLVFCAVVGFSGSFISLFLSKFMAKFMMGVRIVDPKNPSSEVEREVLKVVYRLSEKAGLPRKPEVGIYDSPEVNAFATGPSKSNSLVAVSSGLLMQMDSAAVEGVLAHEISHVANGDMVTMTLIQGVVNTFSMFLSRIFAWAAAQAFAGNRDDDRDSSTVSPMIHMVFVFIFDILFSLLGAIVVAYFSRWREFRADTGGAQLAGRDKMVHALESLKRSFNNVDTSHPAFTSLKINGRGQGLMALFASHPDLDVRIQALRNQPR